MSIHGFDDSMFFDESFDRFGYLPRFPSGLDLELRSGDPILRFPSSCLEIGNPPEGLINDDEEDP